MISSLFEKELRRSPLLSSLDDESLKDILNSSELVRKNQGDMLFSQGDKAKYFYIVRTGTVRLYLLSPDGNEKTIHILNAGNSFAEAVMFMDGNSYPVNCQFLEPGDLFAINSQTYKEILRLNLNMSFPIMADLSRRLQQHVMEINELCLHNATHRLISYLLAFIPNDQEQGEFHLPTQKSILASRLSIQRETFSRILGKLKKGGMISVDGNDIRILNATKMRDELSLT